MKKIKFAFTLAEMSIVLGALGIIAVLTLNALSHVSPDDELLKFKKGYYTVQRTMDALLNSDNYPDGSLQRSAIRVEGADADATLIANADEDEANATFFCRSFASMLNLINSGAAAADDFCVPTSADNSAPFVLGTDDVEDLDAVCIPPEGEEVQVKFETTDRISWWGFDYGFMDEKENANHTRTDYSVICFDIDDVNRGSAPFAFAVRFDGKIILGQRARDILDLGASTIVRP